MLQTRADIEAGEKVLVLGASGGVGHAAVQIADHAGCEVFATASTEEKLSHAEECGADHVIDYEDERLRRRIAELTGRRGVDVVVDHIGEATYPDSLKSMAKGGRLVTCGATTGPNPDAGLNRIFWNQLSVIGSTMATPGGRRRAGARLGRYLRAAHPRHTSDERGRACTRDDREP